LTPTVAARINGNAREILDGFPDVELKDEPKGRKSIAALLRSAHLGWSSDLGDEAGQSRRGSRRGPVSLRRCRYPNGIMRTRL
jgi:hypothetical protein